VLIQVFWKQIPIRQAQNYKRRLVPEITMPVRPQDLNVPDGLQEFLQKFVVACLRRSPEDLHEFAVEYFTEQLDERNSQQAAQAGGTLPGLTGAFKPGQNNESESEKEEDNMDEDRMDDEEEMMMAKKAAYGRRKSVSAEGYDPEADDDEDEEPRVLVPKTDVQRARLTAVVESMLLFKSLDKDQMNQVLDAMAEKSVDAGFHVIDEGDDGDFFYIIESGKFDIYKKIDGEEKLLGSYDGKGSFGELALMYNAPRAATIVSNTEGMLWAMDRATFRKIVVKATAKKRRSYEQFLKKVEILSVLEEHEVTKVADAIETKEYAEGELIFSQGDAPDFFYIVVDGEVDITRKGDDKSDPEKSVHLVTLDSGKFFGELAFLTNSPRAASIHAKGAVKCGCLDVQAFERLLGPCKNLLERNMEIYEKQLASIAEGLSMD
jgi:cAMP-dependent protein kinase regulator